MHLQVLGNLKNTDFEHPVLPQRSKFLSKIFLLYRLPPLMTQLLGRCFMIDYNFACVLFTALMMFCLLFDQPFVLTLPLQCLYFIGFFFYVCHILLQGIFSGTTQTLLVCVSSARSSCTFSTTTSKEYMNSVLLGVSAVICPECCPIP